MGDPSVDPTNWTAILTTAISVIGMGAIAVISQIVQVRLQKNRLNAESQAEYRKNATAAYDTLCKAVYLPPGTDNDNYDALTSFLDKMSTVQRDTAAWIDPTTNKRLGTLIETCMKAIKNETSLLDIHSEIGKFQTYINKTLQDLYNIQIVWRNR